MVWGDLNDLAHSIWRINLMQPVFGMFLAVHLSHMNLQRVFCLMPGCSTATPCHGRLGAAKWCWSGADQRFLRSKWLCLDRPGSSLGIFLPPLGQAPKKPAKAMKGPSFCRSVGGPGCGRRFVGRSHGCWQL